IENQLKLRKVLYTITIYGITKNPSEQDYMMIMDYADEGSLRQMLKKNAHKLTWKDKLLILKSIIFGLEEIHRIDLVHKDFHPGNIVMGSISSAYITDFGLCKPISDINDSEQKINEIIYKYWVDLFESDDESEISQQCKEIQKSNASASTSDQNKLTSFDYTTHSLASYTSQLLNFQNLSDSTTNTT
ncbi:13615_t:CDS:2, partial [Acaulospora colombiana]